MKEFILVLDFGGQHKEMIARAVRNAGVYSEIKPADLSAEEISRLSPIGIIITGGADSVYRSGSPICDPRALRLGIPILGIGYGMQMLCYLHGGEVAPYGAIESACVSLGGKAAPAEAVSPGGEGERDGKGASPGVSEPRRMAVKPASKTSKLFKGLEAPFQAYFNHGDVVTKLPEGFSRTASTETGIAACEDKARKIYGVQFHPESSQTEDGQEIIRRFLYDVCKAKGEYNLAEYMELEIKNIQQKIGDKRVLLALSGGVDSTVCASLLSKAVPGQLTCIFVDHGLMRLHEADEIESLFSKQDLHFIRVDAQKRFLSKLRGVTDPEKKRKIVGREFIRVFELEARKLGSIPFLAQGTIYPDIVESGGALGSTVKSHHNVGGLPKHLAFTEVIEPLAGLFKDEVRRLGLRLGLPASSINRQPFPGPGLSIRIMGGVTGEKLNILRSADAILREELDSTRQRPDQYFAVLTNTKTVGVSEGARTYEPVIAIRAVTTIDFMTCEYAQLPHKLLSRISSRITNEIPSVNRVVYDITSKPPATVEWE